MRFSLQRLFVFVAFAAAAFWLHIVAYPIGSILAWMLFWLFIGLAVYRRENHWPLVAAGLMMLLGMLALPYVAITGHSVPPHLLDRVGRGDTTDQVQSLLGFPTRITHTDSGQSWFYVGPSWCHVRIEFDGDQHVRYVVHDH